MAYVKSNEEIQNEQDLQNLVIGIINRMQEPFKKEKVIECVEYHSRGAKVKDRKRVIENLVDENLDFVYKIDQVRCWGGIYYPKNPISGMYPEEYDKKIADNNAKFVTWS